MKVIEEYRGKVLTAFGFSEAGTVAQSTIDHNFLTYYIGELESLPRNLLSHYAGARWYYLDKSKSIIKQI